MVNQKYSTIKLLLYQSNLLENLIEFSFCKRHQLHDLSGDQSQTCSNTNMYNTMHCFIGLTLYMVMDLYETDLDKHVCNLNDENKAEIIKGLIYALSYFHDRMYCHSDLKPKNILLKDCDSEIKMAITDFGLCTLYESEPILRVHIGGTHPYNSVQDKYYSDKLDIWAFGLIVYYIIASGPDPRDFDRLLRATKEAGTGELDVAQHLDSNALPEYQPIISQCLKRTSSERASVNDIKKILQLRIPEFLTENDAQAERDSSIYYSAGDESFSLVS